MLEVLAYWSLTHDDIIKDTCAGHKPNFNSALVYEVKKPQRRGEGGGGFAGSQPMSTGTAVHMEPK